MSISLPSFDSCRRRLVRAGIFLSLAAVLALGLALPPAARAGIYAKVKPRPPFLPPYDSIQSVDAAKKTIVVAHVHSKDTTTKTYTASKFCDVQVNGVKADFSSLTVGMKVSVSPGSVETEADRILASPAPVEPTASK